MKENPLGTLAGQVEDQKQTNNQDQGAYLEHGAQAHRPSDTTHSRGTNGYPQLEKAVGRAHS